MGILSIDWGSVNNKPDFASLYAPVVHNHDANYYTKPQVDAAIAGIDLSSRVPYTGATANVDLGVYGASGASLTLNQSQATNPDVDSASDRQFRLRNSGTTWFYLSRWANGAGRRMWMGDDFVLSPSLWTMNANLVQFAANGTSIRHRSGVHVFRNLADTADGSIQAGSITASGTIQSDFATAAANRIRWKADDGNYWSIATGGVATVQGLRIVQEGVADRFSITATGISTHGLPFSSGTQTSGNQTINSTSTANGLSINQPYNGNGVNVVLSAAGTAYLFSSTSTQATGFNGAVNSAETWTSATPRAVVTGTMASAVDVPYISGGNFSATQTKPTAGTYGNLAIGVRGVGTATVAGKGIGVCGEGVVGGDLPVVAKRNVFTSFGPYVTCWNESGRSEVELQQGLIAGYGGALTLRAGDVANTGFCRIRYDAGYPKLETTSNWTITGSGSRVRMQSSYIDMGGGTDATNWMVLTGSVNKSRASNGFQSRDLGDTAYSTLTGSQTILPSTEDQTTNYGRTVLKSALIGGGTVNQAIYDIERGGTVTAGWHEFRVLGSPKLTIDSAQLSLSCGLLFTENSYDIGRLNASPARPRNAYVTQGIQAGAPANTAIAAAIHGTAYTDATVASVFQGRAGQTANLTEWRNGANTTLSYMSANGSLMVGGNVGFYGTVPVAKQNLAANPTNAELATVLANLGLVALV